jgi:hypothetical protein
MPWKRAAALPPEDPEIINAGPDTRLTDIRAVASRFGMTMKALAALLKALKIPVLHIATTRYVNELCLDFAIFCLTVPGGPDFAMPGSRVKHLHKNKRGRVNAKVPDRLDDPKFIDRCLVLYTSLTRARASAATEAARRLLHRTRPLRQDTRKRPQPIIRRAKEGTSGSAG